MAIFSHVHSQEKLAITRENIAIRNVDSTKFYSSLIKEFANPFFFSRFKISFFISYHVDILLHPVYVCFHLIVFLVPKRFPSKKFHVDNIIVVEVTFFPTWKIFDSRVYFIPLFLSIFYSKLNSYCYTSKF